MGTDSEIRHPGTDKPETSQPRRRDVVAGIWRLTVWGILGSAGYIGLSFLNSRDADAAPGGIVNAGLVDDFAPGTVTVFEQGVFLLVRANFGGFLALHRRCTHLGCIVLWKEDAQTLHCPCHGSHFHLNGAVIEPPAERPLARFPVEITRAGIVRVDTRTLLKRTEVSDEDFVFPPSEGPKP